MNASVAIQVLPKVESDEEVIRIVDAVIAYIKSTGLNYFVGPCETSIEGDYDELMEIIKECQKVAVKAGAKSVSAYVKINSAKKRYGSCSGTNNLNFSLYLMDKDERFVDYVVVHEIAHIKHHNHSKDFYKFVEKFMPDYKERMKL